MAGNPKRFSHFHAHSGGWGYVEHSHHEKLPDRVHRHVDDPNLGPSSDEEPKPPGMAERPRIPTGPARRLWIPGAGLPPRRN